MSNWQVICGCVGAVLGWWVGAVEQGRGPYVAIGRWRNEQVANKTLRLLNATVPGPSMFFPWSPAPRPPREP